MYPETILLFLSFANCNFWILADLIVNFCFKQTMETIYYWNQNTSIKNGEGQRPDSFEWGIETATLASVWAKWFTNLWTNKNIHLSLAKEFWCLKLDYHNKINQGSDCGWQARETICFCHYSMKTSSFNIAESALPI